MYGGSKPFSASAPDECWITVAGSPDGSTSLKLHVSEALTDRLFPFLSELAQRVPLLCGGAWGGTQVGVGPSWSDSRRWFVAQVGPTRINGPLWITVAGVTANERLTTLPSSLLDEVVARSNSDLGGVVWQLSRDPSGPSGPHLHQWLTALAEADLMPA
jgi:hypothetical protein